MNKNVQIIDNLCVICIKLISDYIRQNSIACGFKTGESWVILSPIEQSIKAKIEAVGVPLRDWDIQINYGIKTGYNEAFIIDGAKKDELIKQDPKSAEIIRPILRGRDIKRYSYEFADLYLITTFPSLKIDIEKYPAVKNHLLSFGMERLEQTGEKYIVNGEGINARKKTNNKWFETQDQIGYWEDFYRQKIVWGEISDKSKFVLDKTSMFPEATTFLMVGNNLKYLLAMLNSKLGEWLFSQIGTTTGVGTIRWKKYTIEQFLVKTPTDQELEKIEKQTEVVLKSATYENITVLDRLIYDLYSLSAMEQKYLENESN